MRGALPSPDVIGALGWAPFPFTPNSSSNGRFMLRWFYRQWWVAGRYHGGRFLMQRRDFLKIAGAAAASNLASGQEHHSFLVPAGSEDVARTEFTLQIAPVTVELAPNRIISTVGYNGISPGPRLRMKEGVPVTVNVINDTDVPEVVHFHGLLIPPEVD